MPPAPGSVAPIIAFDLNGTLLDPAAVAEPLGGDELTREIVTGSFDDAVQQAMAFTLARAARPFISLLEAALRRRLELAGRDTAAVPDAIEVAGRLPAFPEARAALDVLATAGCRVMAVTNSSRQAAEHNLSHVGLLDRFAAVVGADECGAYKPDPRVYALAAVRAGAEPSEMWLVASHWWDVMGASRAGWRTGWVSRKEQRLLESADTPDVAGAHLLEVAEAIAAERSSGTRP